MSYGLPNALQDVLEADEGYIAATGVLSFDESKLPQVDWENQQDTPPVTRLSARLSGKSLTKNGFSNPINTKLNLDVKCFGPWCAGASSGNTVLVFLQQTPTGYSLSTTPCGGHIFTDPTRADLNTVESCYLDGKCPKPQNR